MFKTGLVKIQATNRSEALSSGGVGRTQTRHSLSKPPRLAHTLLVGFLKAFRLIIHTT
jgi:hypothetical protein